MKSLKQVWAAAQRNPPIAKRLKKKSRRSRLFAAKPTSVGGDFAQNIFKPPCRQNVLRKKQISSVSTNTSAARRNPNRESIFKNAAAETAFAEQRLWPGGGAHRKFA